MSERVEGGSSVDSGHARSSFPAECLGEKCPNFTGVECTDSRWDWIIAKGTVKEGRDVTQPPLVAETVFVTYGQVCLTGCDGKAVRYRVDDYHNGAYFYEETGLIRHGDAVFGEGTDVDLVEVSVAKDGTVTEDHKCTFDGWGPTK